VIAAVLRGSKRGRKRYSAHLIADALRCWYHRRKLVPRGISVNAPSIQDWALKATKFKRLAQRARTSRNKAIAELKQELSDFLPKQDAESGDEDSDVEDDDLSGSDGELGALEALGECEADVSCQLPVLTGYDVGYFSEQSLVLKYRKLSLSASASVAPAAKQDTLSEVSTAVSASDSATPAATTTAKLNEIFLKLKQQKLHKTPDQMQNNFVVPPSVLSSIEDMSKAAPVKPFLPSMQWKGQEYESAGEEDETPEPDGSETNDDQQKPKAKAKAKVKAKSAPKVRVEVAAPHGNCYVPGEFRKRKKEYVRECMMDGFLNYWEAQQAWNYSDERRALLSNLSPSELSRRRFD
ncbi:unnamed protein product, partial [Symbiodinium sp. CCMP2456]